MAEMQNGFVWYELMTTDMAAAETFYKSVVGWGAETSPLTPPGMDYRLLTAAGFPSAGLMALPPQAREAGAPPGWLGHVGVADLDAKLAQAGKLGAAICVPATDLPKIGRFACIQDPQGAMLGLFSPECAEPPREPPPMGTPGRIGWHELYATNWQEAFAFYSAMFGWQKAEALDMGAMGTYQLFGHAGQVVGGMMDKPAMLPKPVWQYYVNVAEIAAAAARIAAGGGKVLMGPHQVPGGSWIVQAEDPQGGAFAVVAPRRG